MSDVRAAAERLLKFEGDCGFYGWPDSKNFLVDKFRESLNFVSIYLAEHPADENELITDDWWCGMNNGSRFMFSSNDRLMLFLAVDGTIELCVTDGLQEISYSLPHIKTCGDVRMLCRALGVEVKG